MKDFDEFESWWTASEEAKACRDELLERKRSLSDREAVARLAYERELPLLMLRKYHEWSGER